MFSEHKAPCPYHLHHHNHHASKACNGDGQACPDKKNDLAAAEGSQETAAKRREEGR